MVWEIKLIAEKDKAAVLARLARVEGQIRGLQRLMSEGNADCEKVAQQMMAARKALDKTAHTLLACIVQQSMSSESANAEAIETLISKYV